jgi:hypothetical protein
MDRRRTYATSGVPIRCHFAVNGDVMGSEATIASGEDATFDAQLYGTAPIERVEIISDGDCVWAAEPETAPFAELIARLRRAGENGDALPAWSDYLQVLRDAREIGAAHTIDYTDVDFDDAVREITDGRGVDVVVDHIGGETWPKSIRSLRKGGRLVTCGATAGPSPETDVRRLFWNQLELIGSTMATPGQVDDALSLVWDGTLEPRIRDVLPMSETARAHEMIEEREGFGKVVVVPDSEL